jgi:hypothetical protein
LKIIFEVIQFGNIKMNVPRWSNAAELWKINHGGCSSVSITAKRVAPGRLPSIAKAVEFLKARAFARFSFSDGRERHINGLAVLPSV